MYLFILAGLWRLQSYEEGKTGSGDKLPIVESFFFFNAFVCLFVCLFVLLRQILVVSSYLGHVGSSSLTRV